MLFLRWSFFVQVIPLALAIGVAVDPALDEVGEEDVLFPIMLQFHGRFDLTQLDKEDQTQDTKAELLLSSMKKHTDALATPVIQILKEYPASDVKNIRTLWIANALIFSAKKAVIEELTRVNSIERIDLVKMKAIDLLLPIKGSAFLDFDPTVEWGVRKVKAPQLWEQSVTGKGVVVAVIDSGVNIEHPDLKSNIWKNIGESGVDAKGNQKATNGIDDDQNGYIDDINGFNFSDRSSNVGDLDPEAGGHGSAVAGIIAGKGTGGRKTGVAPDATLMPLRVGGGGLHLVEPGIWEAMQYAVENKADVVSMSMSIKTHSFPDYAKWREVGEVLLAAGVVHVNSAGNTGDVFGAPDNIGAPASNPGPWYPKNQQGVGHTATITVGATDDNDELLEYSGRGPVTWEWIKPYFDFPYEDGFQQGLVKPDVCGPSEVYSTSSLDDGYVPGFNGTSAAQPHVAGVVALILSAHPKLTVAEVAESLLSSAISIGDRFNNGCGSGRVDAEAAVKFADLKFSPSHPI